MKWGRTDPDEKSNSNKVGKGRVVFQHPHECCATPTLERSKWKMGKLLKPILAHQNTPHSPNRKKQWALNHRQLDHVHISACDYGLRTTQQVSIWFANSLSFYKSSKIQSWFLPSPSPIPTQPPPWAGNSICATTQQNMLKQSCIKAKHF